LDLLFRFLAVPNLRQTKTEEDTGVDVGIKAVAVAVAEFDSGDRGRPQRLGYQTEQ